MRRASLVELREMHDAGRLETGRTPLPGEDLPEDFWDTADLVEPRRPTSVHLKLDPEVFDWFKAQGKGHLTRMQAVLAAYVRARKARQAR